MKKRTLLRLSIILLAAVSMLSCWNPNDEGSIEGQVRLEGRENDEGARVYIPGTSRVAITDRYGNFVMDSLPSGRYDLVVEMEGYQNVRKSLAIEGSSDVRIEPIRLTKKEEEPRQGVVAGQVLILEQPPKNPVTVFIRGQGIEKSTLTDVSGAFELKQVPFGEYELFAFAPGYVVHSHPVAVTSPEIIDIGKINLDYGGPVDVTTTQRATAKRTASVTGIVELEGMIRSSGVLVSVEGTSLIAITDREGNFVISDIPPGTYEIVAQKPGFESAKVENVELVAGATEEILLAMSPLEEMEEGTGSVEGTVRITNQPASEVDGFLVTLSGEDGLTYETQTDANGAFEIKEAEPGMYRIEVSGEGIEPYALLGVRVNAGDTTIVGPLELKAVLQKINEDNRSKLSGTVLLEGAENHTGTLVQIEGSDKLTSTDSQGRFAFFELPTGLYDLVLSHDGYEEQTLENIRFRGEGTRVLPPVTLKKETPAPYVLSTEPTNGAMGVRVDADVDVLVVFSERMNGGSVKGAVKIEPPVDHALYFGGESPQSSGNDRLVIRMFRSGQPPVRLNQEYKITIADSARSLMGQPMEEPYEFSFETSGPLIVNTIPQDGVEDIVFGIDDYVMIDFNVMVDYDSLRKSLRIDPRPDSEPILFPQAIPAGSRAKLEILFRDDTKYTVRISGRLRSRDGREFDNTPYEFSFRTGSIQEGEYEDEDLFLEGQYPGER